MLPDMSEVLEEYIQDIILRTRVVVSGGFEDTYTDVDKPIVAVVQVASDDALKALELDYSLDYQQVHMNNVQTFNDESIVPKMNDLVVYDETIYKIIKLRNYSKYGYYEFIIEEVKNGSNN